MSKVIDREKVVDWFDDLRSDANNQKEMYPNDQHIQDWADGLLDTVVSFMSYLWADHFEVTDDN